MKRIKEISNIIKPPRVAVIDIEVSKTIYGCYPSKKPQYLSHNDIIQDWFVICASWKWLDKPTIFHTSLLDDPKRYKANPCDDTHVVQVLHSIVSEADVIIGHNVAKFDWGKILERMMCHRLPPVEKPKLVDTMIMAKQAAFSYNNLDYLCKRLGAAHQKRENGGNAMWMDIVQGKGKARIEECIEYCRGDIPTAEEIYHIMAPYMPTRLIVNQNLWREEDKQGCPYCKSMKYVKDKLRVTTTGSAQSYRCTACGHCFTDGVTLIKAELK